MAYATYFQMVPETASRYLRPALSEWLFAVPCLPSRRNLRALRRQEIIMKNPSNRLKFTQSLFALAIPFLALLLPGCGKQAASPAPQPSAVANEQSLPVTKPPLPPETKPPNLAATNSAMRVLVFRNVRSWNRDPDFEDF